MTRELSRKEEDKNKIIKESILFLNANITTEHIEKEMLKYDHMHRMSAGKLHN